MELALHRPCGARLLINLLHRMKVDRVRPAHRRQADLVLARLVSSFDDAGIDARIGVPAAAIIAPLPLHSVVVDRRRFREPHVDAEETVGRQARHQFADERRDFVEFLRTARNQFDLLRRRGFGARCWAAAALGGCRRRRAGGCAGGGIGTCEQEAEGVGDVLLEQFDGQFRTVGAHDR